MVDGAFIESRGKVATTTPRLRPRDEETYVKVTPVPENEKVKLSITGSEWKASSRSLESKSLRMGAIKATRNLGIISQWRVTPGEPISIDLEIEKEVYVDQQALDIERIQKGIELWLFGLTGIRPRIDSPITGPSTTGPSTTGPSTTVTSDDIGDNLQHCEVYGVGWNWRAYKPYFDNSVNYIEKPMEYALKQAGMAAEVSEFKLRELQGNKATVKIDFKVLRTEKSTKAGIEDSVEAYFTRLKNTVENRPGRPKAGQGWEGSRFDERSSSSSY